MATQSIWRCQTHPQSLLIITGNQRVWSTSMNTTCFLGSAQQPQNGQHKAKCVFEEVTTP